MTVWLVWWGTERDVDARVLGVYARESDAVEVLGKHKEVAAPNECGEWPVGWIEQHEVREALAHPQTGDPA